MSQDPILDNLDPTFFFTTFLAVPVTTDLLVSRKEIHNELLCGGAMKTRTNLAIFNDFSVNLLTGVHVNASSSSCCHGNRVI